MSRYRSQNDLQHGVGLGIAGSLSGGLLGGYLLGHTIIGGAIGLFSGTGIFSSAAILINS